MKTRLNPVVLRWARIRAGLDEATLAQKVIGKKGTARQVAEWEQTGELTFRHAQLLADKTHTPFGYLFLQNPPDEPLPIKDFRTVEAKGVQNPSPNLLEVIYQCQRRQAWYRDFLIANGAKPLPFIGRASVKNSVNDTAEDIRNALQCGPRLSAQADSWEHNLSLHFEAAEDAGIVLNRSGVVANNNRRALSVKEFRGFALCDEYAPLVFVNTRDTQAAQLFTLLHEIAHIWIGESALSNPQKTYAVANEIEFFCNQVAAEVLVPARDFANSWDPRRDPVGEINRIARQYKVSTLVIARRAKDAGFLSLGQYDAFYDDAMEQYLARHKRRMEAVEEGGGDFHNTLRARAGSRFCGALIFNAIEGKTSYKEALSLLDIKNSGTLLNFARRKYGHEAK